MKLKIPYWLKFGTIFTIIVIALILLEISTASSLEFGTWGLIFTAVPVMAFFEAIGFKNFDQANLIIPATLIFIFTIGALIGALVGFFKNQNKIS